MDRVIHCSFVVALLQCYSVTVLQCYTTRLLHCYIARVLLHVKYRTERSGKKCNTVKCFSFYFEINVTKMKQVNLWNEFTNVDYKGNVHNVQCTCFRWTVFFCGTVLCNNPSTHAERRYNVSRRRQNYTCAGSTYTPSIWHCCNIKHTLSM